MQPSLTLHTPCLRHGDVPVREIVLCRPMKDDAEDARTAAICARRGCFGHIVDESSTTAPFITPAIVDRDPP